MKYSYNIKGKTIENKHNLKILLIFILLIPTNVFAQKEKSNLRVYTPSALLNKGSFDFQLFNNFYIQHSYRNDDGKDVELGLSQMFLTTTLTGNYGISYNKRINIGFEVNINRARYSSDDKFSFFSVLGGKYRDASPFVISNLGPRIKIVPFKNYPRFSFQTAVLFPVRDDLEREEMFISHQRTTIWHQFFCDKRLGDKFLLFTDISILYRSAGDEDRDYFLRIPVSLFLSYFPNSKIILFFEAQCAPRLYNKELHDASTFGFQSYYSQIGIGVKYQISRRVNLEMSFTDFSFSRNDGAGNTLNLGVRYIN